MYRSLIKQFIDYIIALLFLPILGVLSVLVFIPIKIEDGGTLFYKGKRLGKDMKEFNIYKFRTMKPNAEDIREADGSTYIASDDVRLTRIGRLLREISIDELPQIINVLRGEMSFIGPRPSPIGNEQLYPDWYKNKFNIKPGITGLVQAFYRNEAPVRLKQRIDILYVRRLSFGLDSKIIIQTIYMVLNKKGIYRLQK
jgi:lipopolysaccharide/colanic/teichoic acid biosynthesis glycosyltransferase